MATIHDDVFLSYSRQDTALMQAVRDTLRAQGFKVWTDEGIQAGTPSWKTAIEDAIQGARFVVVLFSPDSAGSKWVRSELDYAEAQKKSIFPLLVRGDAATAVPFGYTTYQWIDLRDTTHYDAQLERLMKVLRQAMNDEAPTARVSTRDVMARMENHPSKMSTVEAPGIQSPPRIPPVTDPSAPHETLGAPSRRAWLPMAIGAVVLIIIVVAFALLNGTGNPEQANTSTATGDVAQGITPMGDVDLLNRIIDNTGTSAIIADDSLPEGWHRIMGTGYSVAIPETWLRINANAMDEFMQYAFTLLPTTLPMDPREADLVVGDWVRFIGLSIHVDAFGISLSPALLRTRLESIINELTLATGSEFDLDGFQELSIGGNLAVGNSGMLSISADDLEFSFAVYTWETDQRLYTLSLITVSSNKDEIRPLAEQITTSFRIEDSP